MKLALSAVALLALAACDAVGVYAPGDTRVVGAVPMHCERGHPFDNLPDCKAPAGTRRVGTLIVRE